MLLQDKDAHFTANWLVAVQILQACKKTDLRWTYYDWKGDDVHEEIELPDISGFMG